MREGGRKLEEDLGGVSRRDAILVRTRKPRPSGLARKDSSAMKHNTVLAMVMFASLTAAADIPSADVQIAGAVLAAPAEFRDGAAVLGYDAQGRLATIREGKN